MMPAAITPCELRRIHLPRRWVNRARRESRRGTAGGPTGRGPSDAAVVRPLDGVSTSRASGVGPFVPRAAVGPVNLDRYPLRGGPRVDQFERYVRAGVGEQ